jgi:hypothetical protein
MKQSLEDIIRQGQVDNGAQSLFWRLAQRSGSRHFRALLSKLTVHINNVSI